MSRRRAWARWLLAALTWPVMHRLRRVEVQGDTLLGLGSLAGRGVPLVFLPAHRSYADSLVLDSVLRDAGIPRPWRLAGANLAFWPLGPIARRCGTVFIRRDFGFDPGYHAAVRRALADLLARGQSLEWYPEAGRSRTGRLRPLRTGMLRILVSAYRESGVEDVRVVPVSIVYDAVPDIEAVTAEDAGAPKQPEGLGALLRYFRAARVLGPRAAWLTFGESASLRTLTSANDWEAVRALARHIAQNLREATPVTAEALLALALPDPGAATGLAGNLEALTHYTTTHRIPLCHPAPIDAALDGLVRTGVLSHAPEGLTIESARLLTYHRNVAEHWFLPRAAAELVAVGAVTVHRVCELLAPLNAVSPRQVEAELAALDGAFLLAPRLLGPIFEAYYAAALQPLEVVSAELHAAALAALPPPGRNADHARELSLLLARLQEMADVRH